MILPTITALKPALRFSEYADSWKVTKLGDISTFFDGKRVPLSESQRSQRQGNYPYYGASGIIDYVDDFLFDGEFILLGEDGANILNRSTKLAFIAQGQFWVNNHAHVLQSADSNYFLAEYLESLRYEKYNTGTAQPKLNAEVCKQIQINVPEADEQHKIASFLTLVDTKIQQLKHKHTLMRLYKKGVMQQLFSQQARFKDDDGQDYPDWKRELIGKYLEEYKERVSADTDIPVLTSSRAGLYLQKDYYANRELQNDGEYGVLPKGYFTYRHMSDDLTFKFNLNTQYERGAISKEYPVFRTVGMNAYFLILQLNEGAAFKKFAVMQKQGGTRTRLYFRRLKELELSLPCLQEQQKISDVLASIDKKIEQVNAQITQAETFKKGLRQQMFV